jgi:hypothetical protein
VASLTPTAPDPAEGRKDPQFGSFVLSTRYGFRALPSIHILVKNGNVQLEGSVANKFDYNLVNIRAKGVAGACVTVSSGSCWRVFRANTGDHVIAKRGMGD